MLLAQKILFLSWLTEFLVFSISDFHSDKVLSKITFGSCNHHDEEQTLWDNIVKQNSDLWIWLGDAVYADTRILPFVWMPSSLETMKEKYDSQKENLEYKALLESKTKMIGVWDDHDYGIDGGGKSFKYRFQSQNIFLDFMDEPLDSIRRSRKGIYGSYTYGTGDQIVKVILLDVRSHHVTGSNCDVLGEEQWEWFDDQLNDNTSNIIFVGTGKQVLSDIPFIDKWMSCSSSLDRLVWMSQKRSRVIFLSGDVHFSEVNCLNSSGTGYPLYEFTSSGLTHTCSYPKPKSFCVWNLKNVVASRYRVSNVVTNKNFGVIKIDWESTPIWITFELVSENDIVLSSFVISLDDLSLLRRPASCPAAVEQPNWYYKRVFWCSAILAGVFSALIGLRILFIVGRWIVDELLKGLDSNIKRRMKKLRLVLSNYKNKNSKKHQD